MMMLLTSAPVLMDDPVARHFLEQSQYLGGVLARALAAAERERGAGRRQAQTGLRRHAGLGRMLERRRAAGPGAAAPLLRQLTPAIRDAIRESARPRRVGREDQLFERLVDSGVIARVEQGNSRCG